MSEAMKILSVNPDEVEYQLKPVLYKYIVNNGKASDADTLLAHLMSHCDPRYIDDERALNRAKKLVCDFYRDLHTYGLLSHEPFFASVAYQKGLDLRFNVDYVVEVRSLILDRCLNPTRENAVQSAMMAPWNWDKEDNFINLKRRRRIRRGNMKEWTGPIYWLTNKDIPYACNAGGTWLFGSKHISALVEEIKAELKCSEQRPRIAIKEPQLVLF